MFTVIYQFQVKLGLEKAFIEGWKGLTELIYQYEGSLGSRLHRENETSYIAYAQWPDKQTWQNSGKKLPDSADLFRQQMRASCEKIETLHELVVLEDLLQEKGFGFVN